MRRKEDDIEYRVLCKRMEELQEELTGAGYALDALARLMEKEKEAAVVRLISKDLERAVTNAGIIQNRFREGFCKVVIGGVVSGGSGCESEA